MHNACAPWCNAHADPARASDSSLPPKRCSLLTLVLLRAALQLDDAPGTYFWHDHSTVNRANGLQGALILDLAPRSPVKNPFSFNGGDRVLMVTDW
jgi:hypothetical protein